MKRLVSLVNLKLQRKCVTKEKRSSVFVIVVMESRDIRLGAKRMMRGEMRNSRLYHRVSVTNSFAGFPTRIAQMRNR